MPGVSTAWGMIVLPVVMTAVIVTVMVVPSALISWGVLVVGMIVLGMGMTLMPCIIGSAMIVGARCDESSSSTRLSLIAKCHNGAHHAGLVIGGTDANSQCFCHEVHGDALHAGEPRDGLLDFGNA